MVMKVKGAVFRYATGARVLLLGSIYTWWLENIPIIYPIVYS